MKTQLYPTLFLFLLMVSCTASQNSQSRFANKNSPKNPNFSEAKPAQSQFDSLEWVNYGLNVQVEKIVAAYGEKDFEQLEKHMAAQKDEEKRAIIQQLNSVLRNRDSKMQTVLRDIERALYPYNHPSISIFFEDEGVNIQLPNKLMFPTEGNRLSRQGLEILKEMLPILNRPDLEMSIEGHADTRPMRSLDYDENWELSANRTRAVASFFIDEGGIPSNRVSIAARKDYNPVAPNDTERGREFNRRIEITITPARTSLSQLLAHPE